MEPVRITSPISTPPRTVDQPEPDKLSAAVTTVSILKAVPALLILVYGAVLVPTLMFGDNATSDREFIEGTLGLIALVVVPASIALAAQGWFAYQQRFRPLAVIAAALTLVDLGLFIWFLTDGSGQFSTNVGLCFLTMLQGAVTLLATRASAIKKAPAVIAQDELVRH